MHKDFLNGQLIAQDIDFPDIFTPNPTCVPLAFDPAEIPMIFLPIPV